MIRRLSVLFLVAAAFMGAACSSGDKKGSSTATTVFSLQPTTTGVTIPPAQLQATASTVTDLLVANKWADAVKTFSPMMAANFNVEGLKLAWGQVEAQYGKYRSRGATERVRAADKQYVIFDTPMTFGTHSLKSRISFGASGQIEDLKILESNVP